MVEREIERIIIVRPTNYVDYIEIHIWELPIFRGWFLIWQAQKFSFIKASTLIWAIINFLAIIYLLLR